VFLFPKRELIENKYQLNQLLIFKRFSSMGVDRAINKQIGEILFDE
jgi:hypothetical protein